MASFSLIIDWMGLLGYMPPFVQTDGGLSIRGRNVLLSTEKWIASGDAAVALIACISNALCTIIKAQWSCSHKKTRISVSAYNPIFIFEYNCIMCAYVCVYIHIYES